MSAPHPPHVEELLPAFALGALDGDDLRQVEDHLAAGCPECERQLAGWRRDVEELAQAVPPVEPSPLARRRLLAAIAEGGEDGGSQAVRRSAAARRWPWWLAAAAALLLAVWGAREHVEVRRELAWTLAEKERLEERLAASRDQLERALSQSERLATAVRTLTSRDIRPAVLAGLEPAPGAVAHSFVNPEADRALFYAYDLPPLEQGTTYQLWIIAAGRPVSAGTFDVDERGNASLEVDHVRRLAPSIDAWAVTVEPRGGVPQPTGEMVLKG